MVRQSTQSTLNEMRKNIEHFNPSDWYDGVTREELRKDYEEFLEVSNTLDVREMRLISLLRHCRVGEISRFLHAAQQLYKALRTCEDLSKMEDFADIT